MIKMVDEISLINDESDIFYSDQIETGFLGIYNESITNSFKNVNQNFNFPFENLEHFFDFPEDTLIKIDDNDDSGDFPKLYYLSKPIKEQKESSPPFKSEFNFKTKLFKKRGRKSGSQKDGNCHGAKEFDNVQRKIQVNYFTFLINFANDIVKGVLGKKVRLHFKHINYDIKRSISYKFSEDLKKINFSDILKMKLSSKYSNYKEDHNEETLLKVFEKSPMLKNFFTQNNYIKIFKDYYYNNEKELTEIYLDRKKINISSGTKNLYYLLKKNIDSKEEIKRVIKAAYFNGTNYREDKLFITNNTSMDLSLVIENDNKIN